MGANISTVMVVAALAAGLWWGFSRRHSPAGRGVLIVGLAAVMTCDHITASRPPST